MFRYVCAPLYTSLSLFKLKLPSLIVPITLLFSALSMFSSDSAVFLNLSVFGLTVDGAAIWLDSTGYKVISRALSSSLPAESEAPVWTLIVLRR